MSETKDKVDSGAGGRRGGGDGDEVVIKKYANRRLYNTATSSYVTLDYLSDMVKNGDNFVVFDAKSGEDITHSVLTQIIFEEESKGENLLPIQFLRQLIKFYGDSLQGFLPSYLEMSMDAFASNQEQMREKMRNTFGAAPGYAMFEEAAKKNIESFAQAMTMFSPMSGGMGSNAFGVGAAKPAQSERPTADGDADIDVLKAQMAALQKQLDKIDKKNR